jgi:hypothetical protein
VFTRQKLLNVVTLVCHYKNESTIDIYIAFPLKWNKSALTVCIRVGECQMVVLVVSKKWLRKVPIFSLIVYAVRRSNRKRIKVGVVIKKKIVMTS